MLVGAHCGFSFVTEVLPSEKSIFWLTTLLASITVLIFSTADSTSHPSYRSLIQQLFVDSMTC
jgi:hypothetical protein